MRNTLFRPRRRRSTINSMITPTRDRPTSVSSRTSLSRKSLSRTSNSNSNKSSLRWRLVVVVAMIVVPLMILVPVRVGLPVVSAYKDFGYLDSEAIHKRIHGLASRFPDLVSVTSSQERYGLAAAGKSSDCEFDHDNDVHRGCKNWIVTIEDSRAHSDDETPLRYLPEVFLSGALHGNERVGPTTVTEVATLLAEAAHCESLEPTSDDGKECRGALLEDYDLTAPLMRWVARLVTTRRILIAPSPNALGYFRDRREEGHIDPNRDFPFDLKDYSQCMRTIAGRTINELFREHLIQLSFTFHGGMRAIGYEWGAPSHGELSPDDVSQKQVAAGYQAYAGHMDQSSTKYWYPIGDMNSLVYPVRGGMEDWAYGASWDTDLTQPCVPEEFDGYPADRTTYNNVTLRMFNMLVETADLKTPTVDSLGSTEGLFDPDGKGDGHVPRNLRMSLMLIDLVEPYSAITSIVAQAGSARFVVNDDLVPRYPRHPTFCHDAKAMIVPRSALSSDEGGRIAVEWTVGGAFTVDATQLWYARWADLEDTLLDACFGGTHGQPTQDQLDKFEALAERSNDMIHRTTIQSGRARWHGDGPDPKPLAGANPPNPLFSDDIDLGQYEEGDTIAVFASITVDQNWAESPLHTRPIQSHLANARTNPDWYAENDDGTVVVQGRKTWFSVPLTIVIGEATEAEAAEETVEISDISVARFNPGDAGKRAYDGDSPILPSEMILSKRGEDNDSVTITSEAGVTTSSPISYGKLALAAVILVGMVKLMLDQRRRNQKATIRARAAAVANGSDVEMEAMPLGSNSEDSNHESSSWRDDRVLDFEGEEGKAH